MGTIPPGGWDLPEGLDALNLANCGLNGTLPQQLSLPASMEVLNLSSTGLTGGVGSVANWTLPDDLQLDIHNNRLSGEDALAWLPLRRVA